MISRARLRDLAAAAPLIILYAFAIPGLAWQAYSQLVEQGAQSSLISVIDKVTSATFLALQLALFLIRRLPLAKPRAWWPRVIAVVAANCALILIALPRADLSWQLGMVSSLLTVAGTIGAIVVLGWLGRSFSVTPQARGLVVSGPYRLVRHPLYLTEQIALVGIMLQYQQPWSLGVFLVSFFLQFVRMDYEEQVLSEAFPTYDDYAKRTARIIPGVY